MIFRGFSILIFLALIGTGWQANSQDVHSNVDFGPGDLNKMTVRNQLERRHIPLTKQGLTAALENTDPVIRMLAASQLQSDGIKEAIPNLLTAIEKERDLFTKVSLADSIAKLGEQRGISVLESICLDKANLGIARLEAAQNLVFNFHNKNCNPLLEILQASDTAAKRMALQLIPPFQQPSNTSALFDVVSNLLTESDGALRMNAGQALEVLGDMRAAARIRAAIAVEHDLTVRSSLEESLQKLLKSQN